MDDISIDVVDDDGGESVSLFARYLGQRVGYAWLAIEGDQAKLVDIHLYRRDSRWHWWPPFYYRGVNYRGRGVGSRLLSSAIEICEGRGVQSLTGEMHGDITRLTRWYQGMGFQVGPGLAIVRDIRGQESPLFATIQRIDRIP